MTNLSSHWIMLSLPTTGVWRGVLGGSWSVGGQIARERGGRMPKARKPVHRDFLEILVQQHHGLSPTQIVCFVIFIFPTVLGCVQKVLMPHLLNQSTWRQLDRSSGVFSDPFDDKKPLVFFKQLLHVDRGQLLWQVLDQATEFNSRKKMSSNVYYVLNLWGEVCVLGQYIRNLNILATSVLLNYPKVCPLTKKNAKSTVCVSKSFCDHYNPKITPPAGPSAGTLKLSTGVFMFFILAILKKIGHLDH